MHLRSAGALLFLAWLASASPAGYADPAACAPCHRDIWESYRRTGMGRSFYRPAPGNTVEDYSPNNTYYHRASDQYYQMYRREGRYYQRRYQIGPDGQETNAVEMEIDYILGSGNHSRTYLHKTPGGQLIELPLAWYAEKGGYWAMNPGYDRPDHMDFRRKIEKECFYCHNSYPESAPASEGPLLVLEGKIPEGIDCQRCHGPGAAHVAGARAGQPAVQVRGSIVNPARLSGARQLEICLQCHLKSTSRPLPYAIRRFGSGDFYQPGEPLENSVLHFDYAPGSGFDDRFEITGAAYRLLKSACFLKSNGALRCTTCHDPHRVQQGSQAVGHYRQACRNCHAAGLEGLIAAGAHVPSDDCLGCHMPKRRTGDVVHVVMTDHYIQRHVPPRDLLAPLAEGNETTGKPYQGEVALLYPAHLAATPENELYLAAAQVAEGSNLRAGIPRLQAAVGRYRPREAEFWFYLANAYRQTGQNEKAVRYYEEALRRKPALLPAWLDYASALKNLGREPAGAQALETAAKTAPRDSAVLNTLGEVYLDLDRTDQALAVLRRAVESDPDLAEAYNNLGEAYLRKGDRAAAMEALNAAIRLRPGFAAAHHNLANILAASGDFRRAQDHFRRAEALDPESPVIRYNYGRALLVKGMLEEGQAEMEAALSLDPDLAAAHYALGLALSQRGAAEEARKHFERAAELERLRGVRR